VQKRPLRQPDILRVDATKRYKINSK